ncbi:MAG: tetratricopeptide repeat protein [Candidatus Odinarchaeota archaeon]
MASRYLFRLVNKEKYPFYLDYEALERLVLDGKHEKALRELNKMENKGELQREFLLRNQLIRSHIMTDSGDAKSGLQLAEKVLNESQVLNNQFLVVDAVISLSVALIGLERFDECLEVIKNSEESLETAELGQRIGLLERAAVLKYLAGLVYRKKGNLDLSLQKYKESLDINRELGNLFEIADIYNKIGIIHAVKGKFDLAIKNLEQASAMAEDETLLSKILNNTGMIHWQKGDLDQALACYHESLKIFQKRKQKRNIAILLLNIGNINWQKGELNIALEYSQSSLSLFEEQDYKPGMANALNNIGIIYENKGEPDIALQYHLRSLSIREELDNKQDLATSYNNIGHVFQNKGEFEKASAYCEKSLQLFEELGNDLDTCDPLYNLIRLAISRSNSQKAEFYLRKLQVINDKEDNKFIYQLYRFARALLLKTSRDPVKQTEARQLLENIAEEEVIKFEMTVNAMLRLCEVLFDHYTTTDNSNVLNELKERLEVIKTLAEQKEYRGVQLSVLLLQGKLELLLLNLQHARSIFYELFTLVDGKGHDKLLKQCKEELKNLETIDVVSKLMEAVDEKRSNYKERQVEDFMSYLKEIVNRLKL